jgi:hypothetical protein
MSGNPIGFGDYFHREYQPSLPPITFSGTVDIRQPGHLEVDKPGNDSRMQTAQSRWKMRSIFIKGINALANTVFTTAALGTAAHFIDRALVAKDAVAAVAKGQTSFLHNTLGLFPNAYAIHKSDNHYGSLYTVEAIKIVPSLASIRSDNRIVLEAPQQAIKAKYNVSNWDYFNNDVLAVAKVSLSAKNAAVRSGKVKGMIPHRGSQHVVGHARVLKSVTASTHSVHTGFEAGASTEKLDAPSFNKGWMASINEVVQRVLPGHHGQKNLHHHARINDICPQDAGDDLTILIAYKGKLEKIPCPPPLPSNNWTTPDYSPSSPFTPVVDRSHSRVRVVFNLKT